MAPIEGSLDEAVAAAPDRLFALPTYTALLELRTLLAEPRPGGGLLAMTLPLRLAGGRVRRLRRRPAALGRAGGARRRPGRRARGGRGPRRASPGRPRPRGDRAWSATPTCPASSSDVAKQRGVSLTVVAADLASPAEPAAAAAAGARDRPAARDPGARRRARPAAAGAACASCWRPAARWRSPWSTSPRCSAPAPPRRRSSPTCASWRAGSTRASRSGCRSAIEALTVRRLRERVSPRARWSATSTMRSSTGSTPRRSSARRPTPGFLPIGRRQISSGESEADSIVVLLEAPT